MKGDRSLRGSSNTCDARFGVIYGFRLKDEPSPYIMLVASLESSLPPTAPFFSYTCFTLTNRSN